MHLLCEKSRLARDVTNAAPILYLVLEFSSFSGLLGLRKVVLRYTSERGPGKSPYFIWLRMVQADWWILDESKVTQP